MEKVVFGVFAEVFLTNYHLLLDLKFSLLIVFILTSKLLEMVYLFKKST